MASWDYPAVSSPTTASYAPPQVDFSKISNLLQDYYKGADMQRQEEKATAFRNGIPKDASGNIDVGAVTERLAKINPDYAMPLINMQMQSQMGQQAASAITGPGGAAPQSGAQPAPAAPASVPAPRSTPVAAVSGDQPGSIMSMIPDGVSADDTGRIASQVANTFRLDPNAAPPPDMVPRIRAKIASLTGRPVAGPQPSETPASEPAPQTVAQAQSDGQPGMDMGTANRLSGEASYIRARAAALSGVNPKAAEVLTKEADSRDARAKQIRDYLSEEDKSTPDQKNYNSDKMPGESMADYQARSAGGAELAKQDSVAYSKKYEGIQKASVEASIEQPKIQLMKTFSNSPDFYSGVLEPTNRTFKQFAVATGIDPNKALPQEGFNKVASDMLTSQIRALGASGAGPVRIAEVKNMQKSIANLGITPVTNRLLVEITDRTYKDVQAIADLTRKYESNPKNLPGKKNVGLDQAIHDYYQSHPLFSESEIKDPRLIAPPEFKDSRAAFNAKLPKGQPVKIDSKLKWVQ